MSVRDWKGTAKMTVKKLGEIIGTTGDTGGTAAAGTLMAKVNAILNTVMNGVKVSGEVTAKATAQTKEFTTTVYGSVNKGNTKTITGKGRIIIWIDSGGYTVSPSITVDGNSMSGIGRNRGDELGPLELYFNSSVTLGVGSTQAGSYMYYIVQT